MLILIVFCHNILFYVNSNSVLLIEIVFCYNILFSVNTNSFYYLLAVILPRLTRCTLAKLMTNKSHKVDAKSHPSLYPVCNTHTHHLFNFTHIRTTLSPLDLWTDRVGVMELLDRWTEKLAGGPRAGRSDSSH